MNQMRWMLRAKRWAQHPPSAKRVKVTFAIIATCIALYAVEKTIGLPDWMQVERPAKVRLQ